MFWFIIAAVLGLLVGAGITYVVCHYLPQVKVHQRNEVLILEEQEYLESIRTEQKTAKEDLEHLLAEKSHLANHLQIIKAEAEATAKAFFDKEMELVQERFDRALEQVSLKYQEEEEACKEEYLQAISEFAEEFQLGIANQKQEFVDLQAKLKDLREKVNTAVEAAKREEEKKSEKDFYRLVLPESDLQEIACLRQVEPFLRDKEALNKVIWKVYYEKPYTDLVGRVVGSNVKIGIYKITNLENQMCYVGQAVNIADRWRQHIKRGVGAETPTRNKLYPAMASVGLHNFTFEIIEECDRTLLNEREDYWQDYFKAKEFGYSIK